MNFGQVIEIANAACRNHADVNKPYTDGDVKEAIRFVLGEFIRYSRCTRVVGGLTITDASNAMTISSLTTGFIPARQIGNVAFYSDFSPIRFVDLKTVYRKIAESASTTGQPEIAAWRIDTAAVVWPKSDSTYILTVDYCKPLNDLQDSGDTVNIQDEYVRPAIWWGVPAALRYAGREDLVASPMWQKFEKYAQQIAGSAVTDIGEIEYDEDAYL